MLLATISDEYINYLKKIDSKVPDNNYGYGKIKPFVGIVFIINDSQYFAPLTSPKPKHIEIKDNVTLFKIDGGKSGLVNLNNMIPVPTTEFQKIDIENVKNSYYRKLLFEQIRDINKHKTKILYKAKTIYSILKNEPTHRFSKYCCDFKALERASEQYSNYKVSLEHNNANLELEEVTKFSPKEFGLDR